MAEEDRIKREYDEFDYNKDISDDIIKKNHISALKNILRQGELNCRYTACLDELYKHFPPGILLTAKPVYGNDYISIDLIFDEELADKDKKKGTLPEDIAADILKRNFCKDDPTYREGDSHVYEHYGEIPETGRPGILIHFFRFFR